MDLHPFAPERRLGHVYQIEGSFTDVTFAAGNRLPQTLFGEYLGRGEVGEFVVIDVGGLAIFGRILRVGTPTSSADDAVTQFDRRVPVEGRIQLLSTLELGGKATRGISKYPKVGDGVYAASAEAILTVIGTSIDDTVPSLQLGRLSVDESVKVDVPLTRLFGRHLAVVGATGSGKSWTLGHLAESVAALNGKMILIDATGEFRTLGDKARHLSFSATSTEPTGTRLVGIPHYMMRESDLNAFLNPSAGTQLPKLREAVRSLKLVEAIRGDGTADADHTQLISAAGTIRKASQLLKPFYDAMKKYLPQVDGVNAPFDMKALATQVQLECIFPLDRSPVPRNFGDVNNNELGWISSLVSRVNDLLQLQEVMSVIDPSAGTANVIDEIENWIDDPKAHLLRISLKNLTFANNLREIVVNILGQTVLAWARTGMFGDDNPLVVAIDEAHQFFDVTVGDEFASTRLNAFDLIAKEGRKYGLTVCVATQRPGDLPAGVLSQVGMTIVHRLADGRDRQRVEQAAAELDHSATKLLPGLVPGEAILMGVDFPVPVSVKMQRPISPPDSDGPSYKNWKP